MSSTAWNPPFCPRTGVPHSIWPATEPECRVCNAKNPNYAHGASAASTGELLLALQLLLLVSSYIPLVGIFMILLKFLIHPPAPLLQLLPYLRLPRQCHFTLLPSDLVKQRDSSLSLSRRRINPQSCTPAPTRFHLKSSHQLQRCLHQVKQICFPYLFGSAAAASASTRERKQWVGRLRLWCE